MGRRIDMKRIENTTKCQVTFSKRRSSLIKKAHEISVLCDIDILFLAFSPSGRLSKFCSRNRVEDILERYVNLPADKRYHHIKNAEEKMEKLKMFGRIKGEENKLQILNNQIQRMELQIKQSTIELELLEVNLRDYEPDPSFDPSLAQLLWCEKNLKQSLYRVSDRKRLLLLNLATSNDQMRFKKEQTTRDTEFCGGNDQKNWATQNPSSKLLFQLDPWISTPYSAKFRESMLQELAKQSGGISEGKGVVGIANNYSCNLPLIGYQSGIPLLTPKPQVSPHFSVTYPPMQERIGLDTPFQQNPPQAETIVYHWQNNENEKSGSKPISDKLHTDKNEVMKWSMMNSITDLTASNQKVMNMSAADLPITTERIDIVSPLGCERFFSSGNVAAATINNMNIEESDTDGKNLASSTQINPSSQPATDTLLLIDQEMMGNDKVSVAGKPMDELLEWDDFVLAENLNLEDLDIPFE